MVITVATTLHQLSRLERDKGKTHGWNEIPASPAKKPMAHFCMHATLAKFKNSKCQIQNAVASHVNRGVMTNYFSIGCGPCMCMHAKKPSVICIHTCCQDCRQDCHKGLLRDCRKKCHLHLLPRLPPRLLRAKIKIVTSQDQDCREPRLS